MWAVLSVSAWALTPAPDQTITGVSPSGMQTGDVNGDGFDDLLVQVGPAIRTYDGSANGLRTVPNVINGASNTPGFVVVDANGDGTDDVLIISRGLFAYYGWDLDIHRGSPNGLRSGIAWRGHADGGTAPHASAGDFNGDGYGDVGVCDGSSYAGNTTCRVFAGSSTAQMNGVASVLDWSNNNINVPGFVDFDGDGFDDLVLAKPGRVSVYRGTAGAFGYAAASWSWNITISTFAAGDFDGDGYGDAWANGSIVHGSASGPQAPVPVAGLPFAPTAWATSPDVDGDGIDDLVASNPWTAGFRGVVGVLVSGEVLPTVPGPLASVGSPNDNIGSLVAAGDFDGDGYGDRAFTTPNQTIVIMYGP